MPEETNQDRRAHRTCKWRMTLQTCILNTFSRQQLKTFERVHGQHMLEEHTSGFQPNIERLAQFLIQCLWQKFGHQIRDSQSRFSSSKTSYEALKIKAQMPWNLLSFWGKGIKGSFTPRLEIKEEFNTRFIVITWTSLRFKKRIKYPCDRFFSSNVFMQLSNGNVFCWINASTPQYSSTNAFFAEIANLSIRE